MTGMCLEAPFLNQPDPNRCEAGLCIAQRGGGCVNTG
jgi:hypothetical protein